MSEDLNKILQSPNKQVHKATGVLSRLFRQILFDIGVDPLTWDKLMLRYLNDPTNGIPSNDNSKRSSARGNLNKALGKPTMSWKMFITALRFLKPESVEFELKLTWKNKKTTVHRTTIQLIDVSHDDDE